MVRTQLGDELMGQVRELLLQAQGTLETKSRFDPGDLNTPHLDRGQRLRLHGAARRRAASAPSAKRRASTFELRPLGPRADAALDDGVLDFLVAPAGGAQDAHRSEMLFEDTFACVAWPGTRRSAKR
jgi:hypothetical protein